MDKIKDFFGGLSKSTRITVLSCGIFILMTFLILLFFVMFPITPSEKIISGLGREALVSSQNSNSSQSASELDGVVVTTAVTETSLPRVTSTYVTKSKATYTDKVFTTNEGYVYTGYRVPTGDYNESSYNEESVTTTQNYENDYPEVTTPSNSSESTEPISTDVTGDNSSSSPDVSEPTEENSSSVPDESSDSSEPEIPDDSSSDSSGDSPQESVPDLPVPNDPPVL